MPQQTRVVIETSVLIASSIIAAKEGLPNVKDKYHDRSMQLFRFFENQSGIGLVTKTVNRETNTKLSKAVLQQLPANTANDIRSVILDLCWDQLDKRLSLLELREVDADCLYQMRIDIFLFYEGLKRIARKIPNPRKKPHPVHNNIAQLLRLKTETPSPEDQEILAETACLFREENKKVKTAFYLATTDLLMAPLIRERDGSVYSDTITRKIVHKFSVLCDWPERVATRLRHEYGRF